MADCQVSSINNECGPSTSSSKDLSTIPEGRVGQVCKEWLIREDGNLAYQLQSEEISQHYHDNRSKNRIVREDIPIAKNIQLSELQAQQIRFERQQREQAERDEQLAKQMQRKIWLEEEKTRKSKEADERYAQKLLLREKAKQQRKRLEKEKQQVEKLSAQIGADYRVDPLLMLPDSPLQESPPTTFQRILTEDEQELDLSEFCMPPPPGLTPGELKYFLEDQDAEIARLLQQQELKRSKNPEKEKLAVIEAQDFELARMLQKMEKDRVRRIKEKLRAKQQNQIRTRSEDDDDLRISQIDHVNYQRSSTPISLNQFSSAVERNGRADEHEYDVPENHVFRQDNDSHNLTYEEPYQVLSSQQSGDSNSLLHHSFHNIAIDLDPTYQRRIQSNTLFAQSQSNLIESSVDDDYRLSSNGVKLIPTNDSLEKLQRVYNSRPEASIARMAHSSTSSSRSSHASSSSGKSTDSRSYQRKEHLNGRFSSQQSDLFESNEYAPPLPPRDMSLHNRNRCDVETVETLRPMPLPSSVANANNFLPPHHPQHPNRLNIEQSLQPIYNANRNSTTRSSSSSNNLPVQGHRRGFPIEKPKKEKLNKNVDGCKTQ